MRTAILLHLVVFVSFGTFSQETIERMSKEKTESGVSLKIDETLFIDNIIPSDLPQRSEYNSDEIYRKVIQGYINTHANIVIEEKALEMGFTYPSGLTPQESEIRMSRIPKKRTIPVSDEELRLKEQKREQLEKENNDNQ